jgi:two-component system cell cycle sensor histidine kinase/response regulator CckA
VPPLVLVVEDEPQVLSLTCRFLEAAGYACISARSAEEGLRLIEHGDVPDLLVLDIRLPGASGPELALQVHTRYPDIPVLFMSGWVAGVTDADLAALRWDFLPKPFTGPDIAFAAGRLLKRGTTA